MGKEMILGILQARMASSRLPGKVLAPILGRPMLELQIERVRGCQRIQKLVVATSNDSGDKPIAELCDRIKIECFRGDLENVLDRFYQAAKLYGADHIVRLTGDCPLADPGIISGLVDFYFRERCDYASNCQEPTLPDGLDAEIFSFSVLEKAWKEAELPLELEHVTKYIRNHSEKFQIRCLKYKADLSSLRWTVDQEKDLEFVRRVYEALYGDNPEFSMKDVLALLDEQPQLAEMNKKYQRNEGSKIGASSS